MTITFCILPQSYHDTRDENGKNEDLEIVKWSPKHSFVCETWRAKMYVPEYGTNPEKNIAIFCFIKNDAKSKNKLNKAMKASWIQKVWSWFTIVQKVKQEKCVKYEN